MTDEMTALLQQLRMPETLKYITAVRDKACERLKQRGRCSLDAVSFVDQLADGNAIGTRDARENAMFRMQLRDHFNTIRMAGCADGCGAFLVVFVIVMMHLKSGPLGIMGDGVFDILVGCY